MKSNILSFIFFCYLIFSITLCANLASRSKGGIDSAKLAAVCMKGLADNIPPDFCWKRGTDLGVIPTGCPAGYFRSLALCYEYCRPGYRDVLGICWQDCPKGYYDHGLTCFRNISSWYFKNSYIPNSLTNFSDRVPCPEGMYRSGALCYRNCKNIGLENCGIGACSATS